MQTFLISYFIISCRKQVITYEAFITWSKLLSSSTDITQYAPGYQPSLNKQTKKTPPLFCQAQFTSAKCPRFLGNSLLYIFFCERPLKIWFFSEPPKYSSFSSLTPSYLLIITKFLVTVSQFEFFVMNDGEKHFCL